MASTSSPAVPFDLDEARRAYAAYGADLIRTGGGLVRTTPSVIYRAATLFQRYQASIDVHYRSRYRQTSGEPEQNKDHVDKVDYVVPEFAGTESLPSGLVPLVDLRAPLDYCLHHLVEHEDITYLCAACLLIAVKMENPGLRIRPIVDTYMRLANRRCGVAVNEFLKPPPERYEDFKACVVKAEEMVLQELGFQTFVETPFKYVLVYINLVVRDENAATPDDTASRPAPPASPSSQYVAWMSAAVCWLNDIPRSRALALEFSAHELAVCAMAHTCPAPVAAQASKDWIEAFGVSVSRLEVMKSLYERDVGSATVSARQWVDAIRSAMPLPGYLKASEKAMPVAQEAKREDPNEATDSGKTEDAATHKEEEPHTNTTETGEAGVSPAPATSAPTISPPGHPAAPAEPTAVPQPKPQEPADEDEDDGIDLLALRKKRRKEEKEKERREKRHKGKKS